MRRLWLIFAQTVTVSLAILSVVTLLRPDWIPHLPGGAPAAQAGHDATNSRASFRDAAQRALPSVVHIYTTQKATMPRHSSADDPIFQHFFGDAPDEDDDSNAGLGSGVIVDPKGYVLTNFHVIDGADDIEVALNDGRALKAKIIGSDPESDLAVLQVATASETPESLPAISFGRMDNLVVGDVVLAIGNPFGVGQTVTMGIVSALGRSHLGINTFENFIQTDAAVNPGNSGGALVDAQGNLVGINTAIYSRSGGSLGIGFAIPISNARSIMEQIIATGSVTRGWIGVEAQEVADENDDTFGQPSADGALIAGVQRGSPAEAAGIHPGDILMAVDGKSVKDPQVMLDLIAALKPGSKVQFRLTRNKAPFETAITIGKRPPVSHLPAQQP